MTYVNLLAPPLGLPVLSGFGYLLYLIGFAWVPGITAAALAAVRRFRDSGPEHTIQALLLVTSVFFLTRFGVYEQYLIYLFPLFYIDVVLWHPERRSLFALTWVLGFSYLLVDNDMMLRFFGPAFPQAVDFAFGFDRYSEFAWIRYSALYVFGVLFTIHLVQLVRIFLDPQRDPTPWFWRPFARLRSQSRQRPAEVIDDP